ncbi:ion transporter [Vibrio ruber]|uniref:Cyclic nucleotide-gated potassium channel n=1 Tax=Vibrio ruber (strain DSM 16370 / JCM 11486 / BCRC 17186 / CECT 7878 / LMG 23124 / VR1) TaxID=1123498 RepID=A0A1R4LQN3_VIBR1|nr:ion transporter [Vibrio ruber]WNJ97150.1 ion transporter [Vibrio ruber]SJN58778.1 Cyclic nucleotide-gated potassium channel [Vibrio ruber DSM 16370]
MISIAKKIIQDRNIQLKRCFDLFIQMLIFLSLISFSLETLPDISDEFRKYLNLFEVITVGIFTVEYLLRLYYAENKFSFVFSFFGVIDLLAILPFYIGAGLDLRSIRSFRLLRLIRILKLARYNAAMRRIHRAFIIAKEELTLFLMASLIILYLAGVGIYYFENPAQPAAFCSVFHSLWWAVATLTTVGYGDIYPITVGGKIFTFFILIIGLGVVSIPAGIVASALSKARELVDD